MEMVKTCCVYKCNNQYNAAAKVKGTKENKGHGLKLLTGRIGYQMTIVEFVLNISLMGGTVRNQQITITLQQYLHTNLQHQVHLRLKENPDIVAETYQSYNETSGTARKSNTRSTKRTVK
ncbi:hypothetical protein KUTeg_011499 [Tegillarca granosa]|uniref:Uncharacterized protein n=1 Tax=Tegillarca granosa TaxID=220873 RepID=A0ABQ9F5W9_TEGGR|nr:hypothetical protein KUTeg_011499 [Tegillarca granosa]